MLIISGIKDYYDHCVSVYGIDKDMVYDRTKPFLLKNEIYFKKESWEDKPRRAYYKWVVNEKGKSVKKRTLIGALYHFILEVGNTHYVFEVERYKDEDNTIKVIDRLVKVIENVNKVTDAPLALVPCTYQWSFFDNDYKVYNIKKDSIILNPILRDTFIPSHIKSEDVFLKIYDYIVSTKEKEIVDKRNDIQKLEGYGFDKKTSFRKC